MQHERHRVPVTAVAFLSRNIILAGEGNYLNVHDKNTALLKSVLIFESQAIHGISVDKKHASTIFVWGGPLLRALSLNIADDGDFSITSSAVKDAGDWILDAAFASPTDGDIHRVAIVTAHSSLLMTDIHPVALSRDVSTSFKLERLVPGSNCVLYSAHVQWLSPFRCLIAAGTVFGDINVWSASFTVVEGDILADTEIHYSFTAHEGSIFGVQISLPLCLPDSQDAKRVLASCSDDRNIKLWDISDLTHRRTTSPEAQRDTSFSGSRSMKDAAPPLLANIMGHISRIWHVRFLPESSTVPQKILSFGEDASMITWVLTANSNADSIPYVLDKMGVCAAHSGKNIWSVAVDELGNLATGGADGAIAVHSYNANDDQTLAVSSSLLDECTGGDNFRSYSFVDTNVLVSTTERGSIVLIDWSHPQSKPTVKKLSVPFPELSGYSMTANVPGIVFLAGTNGRVIGYAHHSGKLITITTINGKVACLLAYQYCKYWIALTITGLRTRTARLLLVEAPRTKGLRCIKEFILTLPSNFVVTSLAYYYHGTHSYAVLGSRTGSLAVFTGSQGSPPHPMLPSCVYESVHGKEAVTALRIFEDTVGDGDGWLHSTGRDGTFAIHHVYTTKDGIVLVLVHQLRLPFGPNIEGLGHDLDDSDLTYVWGFKNTNFVAYNVSAQREIMTVECGGAHRNWAYQKEGNKSRLVWTKTATLHKKSQSTLPYELLNSGAHGREIKCLAISPFLATIKEQITATGAEDTNIKLFTVRDREFVCLHTLRKHNTGIQHLQWSENADFLFSSGGFEEFFVWKVCSSVPELEIGVMCESTHPRSGTSDLRIMGFDVRTVDADVESESHINFVIKMVYSDSTLKEWRYFDKTWELLAAADYLTACLTDVVHYGKAQLECVTIATDGHIALWRSDEDVASLNWSKRHRVHQSAIHATATHHLADGSIVVVTGGDDNAIGITRLCFSPRTTAATLLIPRAHAAAVTGLVLVALDESTYWLASAGVDQRVKLWQIKIDATTAGVGGIDITQLENVFTAVADVSSLELYICKDGSRCLLVCGVGLDLWKLPAEPGKKLATYMLPFEHRG